MTTSNVIAVSAPAGVDIRDLLPTPLTPVLSERFRSLAVLDMLAASPELADARTLLEVRTYGAVGLHIMNGPDDFERAQALAERWSLAFSREAVTETNVQHYWAGVVNDVTVDLVVCVPRPDPEPEPMICPEPELHRGITGGAAALLALAADGGGPAIAEGPGQ